MLQVETMTNVINTIEEQQRMALDCYTSGIEYGKKSSDSYKQAGEHFAYLKSHMKHREYKKWLEENDIKRQTADFIVNVYNRFSNCSAPQSFKDLSFNQLRELLSLREGEEDSFVEFVKNNDKDLSGLSGRAIRSLVKDYNSIGKETQVTKRASVPKTESNCSAPSNFTKTNSVQRRCPFTADAIIAGLMLLMEMNDWDYNKIDKGNLFSILQENEDYKVDGVIERDLILTRNILHNYCKEARMESDDSIYYNE